MGKKKVNRRRHARFPATAFINKPVIVQPLPPFFGEAIKGLLIDLSAGGMAILLKEYIPLNTKLSLTLKFPDDSLLEAQAVVRRVIPRENKMLHGIEFELIPSGMAEKIERMSADFLSCETRIQNKDLSVCTKECSFYSICTKSQRTQPLLDPSLVNLELVFKQLDQLPVLL